MITLATKFYVLTKKDGSLTEMTGNRLVDAFKGGMKWEDVEITTDKADAQELERKYATIRDINHLLQNMTADQARHAESLLRDTEQLMILADTYA